MAEEMEVPPTAQPDEQTSADASAEDTEAENALRENIQRKGKNAYYYAHAHRVDAPKWDGQEAPRLLEKKPSTSEAPALKAVKKYAWLDEKAKVKIYVPLEDIGEVEADTVSIENTQDSVTLQITTSSSLVHQLQISKLYDNIDDATFRVKPDKIIVTLKKASEFTWHDLKKK